MLYLSVIRQKSLTKRNETDTCPLTNSKRVHVIDPTISLLSDFLTESLPSIWRTHVIAALMCLWSMALCVQIISISSVVVRTLYINVLLTLSSSYTMSEYNQLETQVWLLFWGGGCSLKQLAGINFYLVYL